MRDEVHGSLHVAGEINKMKVCWMFERRHSGCNEELLLTTAIDEFSARTNHE